MRHDCNVTGKRNGNLKLFQDSREGTNAEVHETLNTKNVIEGICVYSTR